MSVRKPCTAVRCMMGHAGVFKDRYPDYGRNIIQHYYYLYGELRTLLETDALSGQDPQPLFVDELSLR